MVHRIGVCTFSFICSIGAAWLLGSCSNTYGIGDNFVPPSRLQGVLVDTLTVRASTVVADSIPTDGASRLLVGIHKDDDLGVIDSRAYLEFSTNYNGQLTNRKTTYSKIQLILVHDRYSYYDTAKSMTVQVYRVVEEMLRSRTGRFYNVSKFSTEALPQGETTYTPRPKDKVFDTLRISLNNQWGGELYNMLVENDRKVRNSSLFREYLRGIMVQAKDDASGPIIGYSTKAQLRLYYNDNEAVPSKERYVAFPLSTNYFNAIKADRTQTPLENIKHPWNPLPSRLSKNRAYIQGGASLTLRLEIPYLRDVRRNNPDWILSDAILSFYAINTPKKDNTPHPLILNSFLADAHGDLTRVSLNPSADAARLKTDVLERDYLYEINEKEFVKNAFNSVDYARNAFAFNLPAAENADTVDRLYVNAVSGGPVGIKLKLYFITPGL